MDNFDEADVQKAYAQAQGKDDETVTLSSRLKQIGRKIQTRTKTAHLPGFNIAPAEYPSITSGLTQEAVEDEDVLLLGGVSLALIPAGDDISLLGDETSLIFGDKHPTENASLGGSTTTGHTSASKLKQSA